MDEGDEKDDDDVEIDAEDDDTWMMNVADGVHV